ncbi:MAG TPA: hypothetical protein VN240_09755 [Propylenella sp.]|nr:hypothetical protein [Propylenella sp.]
MEKGLGIAAFVLLIVSFPIPILGNLLSLLALVLALGAALGGERTWAVVVSVVGGVKLFFLSPSWMLMMYSSRLAAGAGPYGDAVAASQRSTNTAFFYVTAILVAAPVGVALAYTLMRDEELSPRLRKALGRKLDDER